MILVKVTGHKKKLYNASPIYASPYNASPIYASPYNASPIYVSPYNASPISRTLKHF